MSRKYILSVITIPDFIVRKKDELLSVLDKRKATYGPISVRTVIVREGDERKTPITAIEALHRGSAAFKDETCEYPNFLVAKRTISVEELHQLVEALVMQSRLQIKGLIDSPFEGSFSQLSYMESLPSNDPNFVRDWPTKLFAFEAKSKPAVPLGPFVGKDVPLYPGPYELMRQWTGVDPARNSQFMGTVVFMLPDYSVKIEEMRIGTGQITVKVLPKEIQPDQIIGKLYCEKFGGEVLQQDLQLDKSPVTVPLSFVPDYWQFDIISRNTGDILDFKTVHASWTNIPPGVIIEIGAADIEEIIKRGENAEVEFKQEIFKNPDQYLRTVVAFANSTGGTILVGVDDNGGVLGAFDEKTEEKVVSQVRSQCEPMPKLIIDEKVIQEKKVYVILVTEGDNKPYNLKDHGIYVRAGSTDRIASRPELDRLYQNRTSNVWSSVAIR